MSEASRSERPGRRRPLVIATVGVLCAGIVALLVYGLVAGETPKVASKIIPEAERVAAPSLRLPLLEAEATLGEAGTEVALDRFRGRPVVVNFWASWCDPCKDEVPELNRLAESPDWQGVQLLGVNVRDPSSDAKAFMRDYAFRFPSLRARTDRDFSGFPLVGVPETYVIDAQGRLAAQIFGPVTESRLGSLLREAVGGVTRSTSP